MNILKMAIAVCVIGATAVCFAQENKKTVVVRTETMTVTLNRNDAIDLARSALQARRQKIVFDNLGMSAEEARKFWPVYNQFQSKLEPLRDRFVKVLVAYSDKFETLTDSDAKPMIRELLDIQQAEADIRRDFLPKFEAALPARKVARFYQIDNKLNAEIRYQLSLEVPLAETE